MKSDFDRIQDRNAFDEGLYRLLASFLEVEGAYPKESVLAVNVQSREVSIGSREEFSDDWETRELAPFFCDDGGEIIPDCDAIADLAASFFFIC